VKEDMKLELAKTAFVTVGKGRGFVVERRRPAPHVAGIPTVPFLTDYLVVTAAHCLPFLPPAHPASLSHERTYLALLGRASAEPTVAAECLFADPISDVAVLGMPDGHGALFEEGEAYEELVEGHAALLVGRLNPPCDVWLLTLDGQWEQCAVTVSQQLAAANTLTLVGAKDGNRPGTSGSPIVSANGQAVGVVSVGTAENGQVQAEQRGQPRLARVLPAWLVAELNVEP
jgi:hypothetical protein